VSAGTDGWSERSSAIRQNALGLLFPKTVLDRPRLEAFDAWLASAGLTAPVARQVIERRDDAERALRCQEAATAPTASPEPSPAL
jgi:aminopeptidase N